MKNVEMTVEGTKLTITVDLSKEFGPSASGKTIIIASTEGECDDSESGGKGRAQRVPEEVIIEAARLHGASSCIAFPPSFYR